MLYTSLKLMYSTEFLARQKSMITTVVDDFSVIYFTFCQVLYFDKALKESRTWRKVQRNRCPVTPVTAESLLSSMLGYSDVYSKRIISSNKLVQYFMAM